MDLTVICEYFRGWSPTEVRSMTVRERKYWVRVAARRMDLDEVLGPLPEEDDWEEEAG